MFALKQDEWEALRSQGCGSGGTGRRVVARHQEARAGAQATSQHMERISQLPKPRQRMVMEMLEAVLAQPSR